MAFTAADLSTIEEAIATGALRVRFADGREVTYQSADALIRVRALIQGDVAAGAATTNDRTTYLSFGRDS